MDRKKLLEAIDKLPTEQRLRVEDLVAYLSEHTDRRSTSSNDAIDDYLSKPIIARNAKAPKRKDLYDDR